MSNEIDDLSGKLGKADRQYFSFTRDSANKVARRVIVSNDSLPVTFDDGGTSINSYNEISALAGLSTSDVVLYTVPVGKKLKLKSVDYSGENKAVYKVEINASVAAKKRTQYIIYNGKFLFEEILLVAGDIIKLIVENKTNSVADFNGNVQGRLLDA